MTHPGNEVSKHAQSAIFNSSDLFELLIRELIRVEP
jgi:hypothetical protein